MQMMVDQPMIQQFQQPQYMVKQCIIPISQNYLNMPQNKYTQYMENSPVNSQASTTSTSGRRESFNETMAFYDESPDPQTFEIDVKPKKKFFATVAEKKTFIDQYKKKIKTELCKNFMLKGQCQFSDKCSFAHGYHELKEKTHLHSNYKTKPCKSFFYHGFCSYGNRCQYLHQEIKNLPEFYPFLLQLYEKNNLMLFDRNNIFTTRLTALQKYNNILNPESFLKQLSENMNCQRLKVFSMIEQENINNR